MTRNSFWPGVPFLRILLPLLAGIFLGTFLISSLQVSLVVCSLVTLSWLCIEFLVPPRFFVVKKTARFFPFIAIMFFAASLSLDNDERRNALWFGSLYRGNDLLCVRLSEDPVPKNMTDKCEVSITAIARNSMRLPSRGKAILYFPKGCGLKVGDNVLVKKYPDSIIYSGNPGEFNYARFLALKNIYHSGFLKQGEFIRTHNDAGWIEKIISSSRNSILFTIREYIKGDNKVAGLAQALLIGYRGELDKELLQGYSATGVVHIIAVSGLHLGLIFIVLNYILVFVFRNKKASFRALIIILFLWFFSLLTGCSASVLRAAVMFTLVIIGKTWFRKTSVYNTLSASAVLLLLYDPNLLWDAGFQLSYLAVTGIVCLQPLIFRSLYSPVKAIRKLWELCSVTLAAQITTLPVCLYYFHQFPLLFLLANLIVVPLSTIILFAEILLICISWWDAAAMVVGWLTGNLIYFMNLVVTWFASIPYSILQNLYINEFGIISVFLLVTGIAGFFIYRSRVGAWITISGFLLLSFSLARRKMDIVSRKDLVVYKMPGRGIELFNGRKSLVLGDTIPNLVIFSDARNFLGIRETSILNADVFSFGGINVVIMDARAGKNFYGDFRIDILIVTGNPAPAEDFLRKYRPSMVVMDGSNRLWKIAKWKTLCDQLLLRFHSVPAQGAFIYSL